MGDDVKITVIATGFKQQEMPARRERMLSESNLPTVRYEVPVEPRISMPRSTVSMPKFASDNELTPSTPVERTERHEAPHIEPELRPVPASVFDDDFFQRPPERVSPSYVVADESVRIEVGLREPAYFMPAESVQSDVPAMDMGVRAPFSGSTAADAAEPDELDIPAFLRRGH